MTSLETVRAAFVKERLKLQVAYELLLESEAVDRKATRERVLGLAISCGELFAAMETEELRAGLVPKDSLREAFWRWNTLIVMSLPDV